MKIEYVLVGAGLVIGAGALAVRFAGDGDSEHGAEARAAGPAQQSEVAPAEVRPDAALLARVAAGEATRDEVGDALYDAAIMKLAREALVKVPDGERDHWVARRMGYRAAEELDGVLDSGELPLDVENELLEVQGEYEVLFNCYCEARERAWLDPDNVGVFGPEDGGARFEFTRGKGSRKLKSVDIGDRTVIFLFFELRDREFKEADRELEPRRLAIRRRIHALGKR